MNFYFITDEQLTVKGVLSDVEQALLAGANVIQYRDKEGATKHMHETGLKIRDLCTEYGAMYIVNDRVDIALSTEADGVHIGPEDLPLDAARRMMHSGTIGVSVSNLEEAAAAERGGADYLGVTPIFHTATKPDAGIPVGLETLRVISRNTHIPLVAIGGIKMENIGEVIGAGATSVSAISATVGEDVRARVLEFIEEIGRWKK